MARILIIDDMPWVLNTVAMMLRQHGHQVTALEDSQAACSVLEDQEFDLVLTDVLMPDLDGRDLIRHIRERSDYLPIIAMTGGGRSISNMEEFFMDLYELADSVMKKPFTIREIGDEVGRILALKEQGSHGRECSGIITTS
ncbi:MAG: response regulator [Proteobacteria bacterium]|nr:response regulator [Pseudomonadota bacterium]